ncbi:MAG: hypothetical protein PHO48_01930 [Candidatus Gracilibacteria bacterium]|nr:hypothetical protein [Candidatus Gracilibacteria bacterium]MDD5178903.1 hypothetical protein [Candidatus Gracilibacteria bacterium]
MRNFLENISTKTWLGILIAIALLQVWIVKDAVMGDAFIHFVFARGIAEGDWFSYNGVFSAGSTSPLWSILLAPVWKFAGDGIIVGVKIFASIFVAAAIPLTYLVAEKIAGKRNLSLAAAALLAGSYVLSFWAAKGMETPLYVCLVLGSFLAYLEILRKEKSVKLEILLGILLGLTILARPEGWFLAAFLGIPLLVRKGKRVIFSVGIPAAIIFSPYYWWLWENTQQIFPSSAARILRAAQWSKKFGVFYFTPEIGKILLTKLLPATPFFAFFWWQEKGKDWWKLFPIAAWLTFHAIFFTIIFPTTEGYRYILSTLPFFYLIAVMGVWKIEAAKWRNLALVLVLLGSFAISTQQLVERKHSVEICEAPHIDSVRRETGLWLKHNTSENDVIAMKEIDQSAYYSDRKMLSMDATLNAKAIPFVKSGKQLEFIQQEKPNYLVVEEDMYVLYPAWEKSNLIPLIDNQLQIGATKELGGVKFTLVKKLPLGGKQDCINFQANYSWYIFRVEF